MTTEESGWSPARSPLDRLLRRAGLLRGDPGDGRRIALAFVAVAWLPFAAIEFVTLAVSGRFDPAFLSPAVHCRLLIAVPLFLESQRVFETRFAICAARLLDGRLIAAERRSGLHACITRASRRHGSALAEIALLASALAIGQLGFWTGHSHLISGEAAARTVGLAWYGFVSLPIFVFLLLRWLWLWAGWSALLWDVSRLELSLEPMHPDRSGGLGFLVGPLQAFCLFLLASAAVVAATLAQSMAVEGASIDSFVLEIVTLLVASEILALGPMLVFGRKLIRLRLLGVERYGALGLDYVRLFHRRWLGAEDLTELLGSPDIQSLADYQGAYRALEETRVVPFGRTEVLLVAAAVLFPMIPILLLALPIEELLVRILGTLL